MGEYGLCECEDTWYNRAGSCAPGVGQEMSLRGCPTVAELRICDSAQDTAWCQSKDKRCKGQVGNEVGQGWFACDSETQNHAGKTNSDIKVAIATSVVVTFMFCGLLVCAALYAARQYRYDIYSYYAGIDTLPA
jgi:hypothetical protein